LIINVTTNINLHMTFFEPIKGNLEKNNVPIVLIDVSGSTNSKLRNMEKILHAQGKPRK